MELGGVCLLGTLASAVPETLLGPIVGGLKAGGESSPAAAGALAESLDGQLCFRLPAGVRLRVLTGRERRVLELRFGLADGYSRTLEEVGKQFKVTRERIRQIEAKALRKMRHPTRIRQLEGFLDMTQE